MHVIAAPRLRWWVLAVVAGGQFMFVVDTFIVNVAIPSIRADLGASDGAMQAVIAIYQIGFATLVITGGRMGDLYGRKRLFLIGLLGFTAASVDYGLATSPAMLSSINAMFRDAARARAFIVASWHGTKRADGPGVAARTGPASHATTPAAV